MQMILVHSAAIETWAKSGIYVRYSIPTKETIKEKATINKY